MLSLGADVLPEYKLQQPRMHRYESWKQSPIDVIVIVIVKLDVARLLWANAKAPPSQSMVKLSTTTKKTVKESIAHIFT